MSKEQTPIEEIIVMLEKQIDEINTILNECEAEVRSMWKAKKAHIQDFVQLLEVNKYKEQQYANVKVLEALEMIEEKISLNESMSDYAIGTDELRVFIETEVKPKYK